MNTKLKISLITAMILFISGCSFLGSALDLISSMGSSSNNSGSQKTLTVDTDLNNQQGDNNYTGQGGKVTTKKIQRSKVAGNDQNNFQANTITIKKDSFWEILISLIIGVVITVFIFWMMPQHPQKLSKWVKSKIDNVKAKKARG